MFVWFFLFSLPSLSSGLLSSLRVFGNMTIHLFFYCLTPLMAFVSRRRKSGDEDNLRDFFLLPFFTFLLKILSLLFRLSFECSSYLLIPAALLSSLDEGIHHFNLLCDIQHANLDHVGSLLVMIKY